MSGLHRGGLHGIRWQYFNVHFMNDKTPPGWLLGCELDLDKYEKLCDDWWFGVHHVKTLGSNPRTAKVNWPVVGDGCNRVTRPSRRAGRTKRFRPPSFTPRAGLSFILVHASLPVCCSCGLSGKPSPRRPLKGQW